MFQWTATDMRQKGVVFWYVFNFLKPFGYKLLGVFCPFQSDVRRFRFIVKILQANLGDSTEMRYLFSQDSGLR